MGCGASAPSAPPSTSSEQPIWKQHGGAASSSVNNAVKLKRAQSVTRMSERTKDAVRDMFSEYRRQSDAQYETIEEEEEDEDDDEEAAEEGGKEGSAPQASPSGSRKNKKRVMTREGLRKILQDIDEDLFEFLWRLFDVDDVGTVDADNFVMAMGLLTQQVTTVDDQIEAAFYMFDVEKAGVLTPSKFEEMIKATVNLSLGQLLNTETGMNEFEAVLQKEYSEENLDFWRRARAYGSLDAGAARLAEAESLVTEFVTEGSMRQVNLPSKVAQKVAADFDAAKGTGDAPADLFDDASAEIFRLMERDTYSRFRRDEQSIKKLVASFHREAGVGENDNVTFEQFRIWALSNPAVLICFTGLTRSIQRVLDQRKAKSAAMSGDGVA